LTKPEIKRLQDRVDVIALKTPSQPRPDYKPLIQKMTTPERDRLFDLIQTHDDEGIMKLIREVKARIDRDNHGENP
jgi:hypothetical protein